MTWTHYLLVFRLESPLHIGHRKAGNLMQTRRYVPGKNLWAALTERLVYMAGQAPNAQAYRRVGTALKQSFRFGYLWPAQATEKDEQGNWCPPTRPHFPWDESDLAYWDYLYLDGTARTAQIAEARTAAEGSLHEVEFIAPYTREGHPVYLVGDLWVREDGLPEQADSVPLKNAWQNALRRLQIGGERTYGWGQVALVSELRALQSRQTSWGWTYQDQGQKIVLVIPTNARLPVHALAADLDSQSAIQPAEGPIEPWLGWERNEQGFRLPQARIMYAPGARVKDNFTVLVAPWGYLYQNKDGS